MECPVEISSLAVMKKRVEEKHVFRNRLFFDTKTFSKNLQEVLSLPPVPQTENSERKLTQAPAFCCTVQTYFLEANDDYDFLQFMVDRKQHLMRLYGKLFRQNRKKVQLKSNWKNQPQKMKTPLISLFT